jgi:phage terminase small subunit
MPKITPKQRMFAAYYVLYGDASKAAREAGYSKKTAYSIGAENLRKPQVKALVEKGQQRQLARSEAKTDAACDAMRTLAYTDRTLMFDSHCNLLPLDQWPQALKDCVEGIEVIIKNVEAGDGHTDRVVKVKLSSKLDALREVARMEGRYPKATESDDGDATRALIMGMVLEGRQRWREFQAQGQRVIEGEVSR